MGYVMFRLKDKMRLIAKLKGVRDDIEDPDSDCCTFWEIDPKMPMYVDRFDNVWTKPKMSKEVYEHGACYIRITEDNEIECEFNEDESIELESGGMLAWIISN